MCPVSRILGVLSLFGGVWVGLGVAGCSFDSAGVSSMNGSDGSVRDGAMPDGSVVVDDAGNMIDAAPVVDDAGNVIDAAPLDAFVFLDAAPLDAFVFLDAAAPDAFVFQDAAIVLGQGELGTTGNAGTITIDGMFGDWPAGAATFPLTVNNASPMSHEHIGASSGDADLSARVTSISDTTAFYLRVEVMDDTVRTDSTSFYNDDSFTMLLDAPAVSSAARAGYQPEDRRYYFRANDQVEDGFAANSVVTDGITFKVRATAAGYDIEIRVPWAMYGSNGRPPSGTKFRFGMQLTDDDSGNSGADHWLAWFRGASTCAACCPGIGAHPDVWCDPTTIGNLVVLP